MFLKRTMLLVALLLTIVGLDPEVVALLRVPEYGKIIM
jgi:hypothetical protein